jgi:hypothetical protein
MSPSNRTIRAPQGLNSKTFKALPIDTQLTVPEVFAHHAKNSSEHNLFVYADGDSIKPITYAQAYRAQLRTARAVKNAYESTPHLHTSPEERPVIGILAVSGVFFRVARSGPCSLRLQTVSCIPR